MFALPDPLADILGNKLERHIAKTLLSSTYSASITALWSSKQSRLTQWLGLGQVERDVATATYLSLQPMVESGDLVLTVPKDLLASGNLSRFQTEEKK